jgi:hypothetical protein
MAKNNANKSKRVPFQIKDCALAAIATGRRAQNLRELRDHLMTIHPGSIYYHFWGGLLRPRFDDPEYHNDFARWARDGLHDARLAERLGVIDPADFTNLEELRQETAEVIEERLDETELVPWSKPDKQFHFIRSQIVVFDTHHRIDQPKELATVVPHLSVSSVFYHFVDARRRPPEAIDDFRAWLAGFGERYTTLCEQLAEVDPYFVTLAELRDELTGLFQTHFKKRGGR